MTEVPTRLLRDALGRMDENSPDCLDANTLAAWADDSLTRQERAAVETHASGCARCQALLAAMVRTDVSQRESGPAIENGLRIKFKLRWLVPIAAAAAAVALWIAVPTRTGRSSATLPAVQPPPQAEATLRNDALSEPVPASPISPNQRRQREARQDSRQEKVASKALADVAAKEEPRALTPPPPAQPTAPPPATSELAAQAPRANALAGARGFADRATVAATPIVSPDATSRWRISTAGTVDHSTDGGTTWESQVTGVAVTLSAGAAPSRDVCWIVGPRGTVVLSTDGHLWRRVPFPEAIDLVAVRASDAANATVSARDGRLFVTRDGGATWQSP